MKVVDKRDTEKKHIRRRRECLDCEKRFTTYERIEEEPLVVVKKDGRRETFDRNKIMIGIMKACEKRPISQEKIDQIVSSVENDVRNLDSQEVKSRKIGESIVSRLKDVDDVAYIRFASVYRRFRDTDAFEKEIKELKGR